MIPHTDPGQISISPESTLVPAWPISNVVFQTFALRSSQVIILAYLVLFRNFLRSCAFPNTTFKSSFHSPHF